MSVNVHLCSAHSLTPCQYVHCTWGISEGDGEREDGGREGRYFEEGAVTGSVQREICRRG